MYDMYQSIENIHSRITAKELSVIGGYLITILMYSLCCRFSFSKTMIDTINIELLRYIPGQPNIRTFLYIFGIAVAGYLIFKIRRSLLCLDTVLLAVYSLVLVGTAIFGKDIHAIANLQYSYWIVEPLFICYYMARIMTEDDWKCLLRRIIIPSSLLWGVACGVSFYYYLINYQGKFFFGNINSVNPQGVQEGRLFGAFSDANIASVISILIVIGMLYLLLQHELNLFMRVLFCVFIGLNIIYMVLAFSRTCFVAVFSLLLVFSVYYVFSKKNETGSNLIIRIGKSILLFIILSVIAVGVYFAVYYMCRFLGSLIVPDRDPKELVRPYIGEGNVTSLRYYVWGDYFDMWLHRPLFGYSADGSLTYAIEHRPDLFISSYHLVPHNMYIDVLTQSGAVGFLSLGLFVAVPNVAFIRRFFKNPKGIPAYMCILFVWEVTVLVSGMFYCMGVTPILFHSDILWLALGGIAVFSLKPKDKAKNNGIADEAG